MSDPKLATRAAELLIEELGITTLPVDPITIARDHHIHVEAMPASSPGGVSGMLIYAEGKHVILYATHINNEGFQRFSIGHELGHYFLPGHHEAVFQNGMSHYSMAGASSNRYEKEADQFSSGLLMPRQLFDPALRSAGEGMEAIKYLRERCRTSTTATAIRYTQRTSELAAVVISAGNTIQHAHLSDELKDYPGVNWIKKNTPLPADSLTRHFNSEESNVISQQESQRPADFSDWFGDGVRGELLEEVLGLGSYGRTLTVLTAADVPDQEELEEESELEDSWDVRFRR